MTASLLPWLLLALALAALAAMAAWALAARRRWRADAARLAEQAAALAQGRALDAGAPASPELLSLAASLDTLAAQVQRGVAVQAGEVAALQRAAQVDAVSGLLRREPFLARLQGELCSTGGPGLALLLLRLRDLAGANERLGHADTDRLIGVVAGALSAYLDRVPGALAGRLNGSDFALALPIAGVAAETAKSLHEALAASPALRGSGVQLALGALDAPAGMAPQALLAAADATLARAEAGEGVAVNGHDAPEAEQGGSRAWRERIVAALDEGRACLAEFAVLDREGGLLHWECPLRAQLLAGGEFQPAGRWLALAQRGRLMPRVDLAALELALAACAADDRPRAVNMSLAAMAAPGFVDEVTRRLEAAPRAAARLAIEWAPGDGDEHSLQVARSAALAWRERGVYLGLEHAGADPQALPRWQALGLSYVKVDRRHLAGLPAPEGSRGASGSAAVAAHARGLVELLHGLGLQALAEGVERADELPALWALGFDGATGPGVRAVR